MQGPFPKSEFYERYNIYYNNRSLPERSLDALPSGDRSKFNHNYEHRFPRSRRVVLPAIPTAASRRPGDSARRFAHYFSHEIGRFLSRSRGAAGQRERRAVDGRRARRGAGRQPRGPEERRYPPG